MFLNGWQLRYLNGDHKVYGLGTAIFRIKRENDELKWEAGGVITDDDFDDPYRWCYRYTLLAWNPAAYAATRDDRDIHAFYGDNAAGWETALSFHPTYISIGYVTPPSAAILPRGFGFLWAENREEHNLLQLAYNLDYGEKFIAGGKRYVSGASIQDGLDRVEGNSAYSWETKTIFKDNDLKRDHITGEIVSVVSGSRVRTVQPPFTIVPQEDHANCIATDDPSSEARTIERVPFPVAVPVLTGWDLRYVCDDEPVEEVGIWIENFEYIPGGDNGMLNYTVTSVLNDEDKGEDNRFRHRVSILGFDRTP